jgi:ribosomal protein S6--L-glutamate ligase
VHHPHSDACPKPSLFTRAWEEIATLNISFTWSCIDDLEVQGDDVVVRQTKEILKPKIVLPFYYSFEEERFAPLIQAWIAKGAISSRCGVSLSNDKALSANLFREEGILHPKTSAFSKIGEIDAILKIIDLPCVFKPIQGRQGEGIFLVHSKKDIRERFEKYKTDDGALLQELIEPMGCDIRAFVIGGQVVASMERLAPEGELVTNYSKHKNAKTIKLSKNEEMLAVKASGVFGLEYSGVDLMRDENGLTYVLEVNARPAIAIEKVTGVNIVKAWLDYFLGQ